MSRVIRCASCQAPLRLPAVLLGQLVRCCRCRATFPTFPPEPEPPPPAGDLSAATAPQRWSSPVLVPVGFLVVVLVAVGLAWLLSPGRRPIPPDQWQVFSPPGGGFQVSLPGTAVPCADPLLGDWWDLRAYNVERPEERLSFVVGYGKWEREIDEITFEFYLDQVRRSLLERNPGSVLTSERPIHPSGWYGGEMLLSRPQDLLIVRFCSLGRDFCLLLVEGGRANPKSADVQQFFRSFVATK